VRWPLVVLGLQLLAPAVSAQGMRPFSTYRQLHGETRLSARLSYATGARRLAPGRPGELYRMDASYDEGRYVPLSGYDAARGEVELGVKPSGGGGLRTVSTGQLRQTASITFSPRVDLALAMTLGAADADLELGGLRLTDLSLQTGASRTVLRFSQPNGTRCRTASLSAGAAELSVLGLGNSRCDRIEFEGGVGRVTLDFAGAGAPESHVSVKMALGAVTLRLPRHAGVRITLDKLLASFDPAGLERRGNAFVSAGYERAERRVDIEVTTAVGGVTVEWEDEGD
jgi:hypothetical protein